MMLKLKAQADGYDIRTPYKAFYPQTRAVLKSLRHNAERRAAEVVVDVVEYLEVRVVRVSVSRAVPKWTSLCFFECLIRQTPELNFVLKRNLPKN